MIIFIHKGYRGGMSQDLESGMWHGRVLDTGDIVTFKGSTPLEALQEFRNSVDDWLEFIAENDRDFQACKTIVQNNAELFKRLANN